MSNYYDCVRIFMRSGVIGNITWHDMCMGSPKWKTTILFGAILILSLFPIPTAHALVTEGEGADEGDFLLRSVEVNRINLALKEIDIVTSLYVVVNGPFTMIAWIPWREGHTFLANGIPVPESPSHYEYRLNEMPMKNLKITTVGRVIPAFPGANPFPFECYETELIFGFNASGMIVSTGFLKPTAWLSWDLEQGGVWNVTVRVNATDAVSLSKWAGAEDVISSQNLTSFFNIVISLSHLPDYVGKMFVPAWGPFVFLFVLSMIQFLVIRRKLTRGDHVGMFIGASVFALGQALAMREVTPPELTLAELTTFSLTMIYLLALALVIRSGSHARDR